ncbi:MAG: 4-amino-4-deoxychorismate lyase [Actinomycetota bacterium]|jgi:4-amino-4-deoxychorismate lyase|nr:4-amino-4-deoxychorismate lyase [Actinomycetota bacterium]
MLDRVLVISVPGGPPRVVPAGEPLLRGDDLGVLRGDGVFETLHVRSGRPFLLAEHLDRMARSAERLDLPLPPVPRLEALADTACGAWAAHREGALRLVCTRGPEDGGEPTLFATVAGIKDALRDQRRAGIRVVTASLGVTADARDGAPWLLGGVKSLSYAANMAAQRWAAAQGVDDVLYVSSDGQVLEGPTSTVVWRDSGVLATVPDSTGILPGTTAAHLLSRAAELGLTAELRMAVPADLLAADGVWFASSVRGVVPFTELDGKPLTVDPLTPGLRDLLGYPA